MEELGEVKNDLFMDSVNRKAMKNLLVESIL